MKKLLSLLSLLTISGSAVPTTIAASPYQKEKTLNSEINYSQTNNNLKRKKRQDNEQNIFGILKLVIQTNDCVDSSGVALNNKVYFGSYDNKVYEYDQTTGQQKVVIKTNNNISSNILVINNKLYVCSYDPNVYEYDPATGQQKVVIQTNAYFSYGVALNNKIYFGSYNNNVYEYEPLKFIEHNIIDIKEQIKRGLYLEYKKQNPNYQIKKISNINLENLILSDVTIEQTQKYISSNLMENIGNICPNFNSTFVNNSSIEQNQNTPSCSTQLTETNTFQKMNGFSKSETTSNTDNWSANVNTKVTAKAGVSAGIPFIAEGKVEVAVEVGGGYLWGESQTYNIGDTSNSSDTEIKKTTNNITINIPSQSVKVPGKSKISIFITSWVNNIQIILSYYQKVNGIVSADFIDQNNNNSTLSISIKNAMINLQENNILPSKININNDNSINFSYDIKSIEQIIMHNTVISESIPLSSYEQNEIFKDKTTSMLVIKS